MPNGDVFLQELKKWQGQVNYWQTEATTRQTNYQKSMELLQSEVLRKELGWGLSTAIKYVGAEKALPFAQPGVALVERARQISAGEIPPYAPISGFKPSTFERITAAFLKTGGVLYPEAELNLAKTATGKLAESNWLVWFYNAAPEMMKLGKVSSYEDILSLPNAPSADVLSPAAVDIARKAVEQMKQSITPITEAGVPSWAGITPEQEEEVRKFLEGATAKPTPMQTINTMTVDEIAKALRIIPTAAAELPYSEEETLKIMSLMDISADQLKDASNTEALITEYSKAIAAQQQEISNVLAGLSEWKTPKLSTWSNLKLLATSPFQVVGDVFQPYIEHVTYPLAGSVVVTFQRLWPGYQGLEQAYDEMKASGTNWWTAPGEVWKKWGAPWYLKLPVEIIVDPLTWIPGWGLSKPAALAKRIGLIKVGSALTSINRGMYAALDIPFDLFKTVWRSIPRSFSQEIGYEVNQTLAHVWAAADIVSPGARTAESFEKAINSSLEAFRANPAGKDILSNLGRELSEFAPMHPEQLQMWSSKLGGKLTEEASKMPSVSQQVSDAMVGMVNKTLPTEAAAKIIAGALDVADSPTVIKQIAKDTTAYLNRFIRGAQDAVRVAKTTKLDPFFSGMQIIKNSRTNVIKALQVSRKADGDFLTGIVLGLQRYTEAWTRGRFQRILDQYLIRPMAEANLCSISYPIWNAFEGIAVSLLEGVTPGFAKINVARQLFHGLPLDPAIRNTIENIEKLASDAAQMTGMGKNNAFSLVRIVIPEEFSIFGKALTTPKWLAGKDYAQWFSMAKMLDLSNFLGNHLRVNFITKKMAQHLAELSYDVAGKDINAVMKKLIKGKSPYLSSSKLGLTKEVLEDEAWYRMMTGDKNFLLSLTDDLSNGSLMIDQQMKILRKADLFSPRAQALCQQDIAAGKVLAGIAPEGKLPEAFIKATEADVLRMESQVARQRLVVEEARSTFERVVPPEAKLVMPRTGAEALETLVDMSVATPDVVKAAETLRDELKIWKDLDDATTGVKKFLAEAKAYKVPVDPYEGINKLAKKAADESIADLRARPQALPEAFTDMANQVELTDIKTADDLMDIYQIHYTMSLDAYNLPSVMMNRTFEDAAVLRKAGKFQQIDRLWRTKREEMTTVVDSVNTSLERTKAKIMTNTGKLAPEQSDAMIQILDFMSARNSLRESVLQADRDVLDTFWAQPRAQRDYEKFWTDRQTLWASYRKESAVFAGQDFLQGESFARLYNKLPPERLTPVDASARALSQDDVAKVFGCNVDNLTQGLMENTARTQFKEDFVQIVLQKARSRPNLFKGFTEEKIGKVYDDILEGIKMRPGATGTVTSRETVGTIYYRGIGEAKGRKFGQFGQFFTKYEKDAKELFGPKVVTARLKFTNSLKASDEIDAAKKLGMLSEFKSLGGEGTWEAEEALSKKAAEAGYDAIDMDEWVVTLNDSVINPVGKETKQIITLGIDEQKILHQAEAMRQDFINLKLAGTVTPAEQEAISNWVKQLAEGVDEIFGTAKVKGIITREQWQAIREKANGLAHQDYYKAFADYTNQNMVDAMMRTVYPYWTYHTYRWFFLPRTFIRHPGVAAAWGKYQNYSDYGYIHLPGTNLDLNPFVGSVMGATFGLARHDYKSYYENLGAVGEALDLSQRYGFFPNAWYNGLVTFTPVLSGRPPEFGSMLPPPARFGLNLLRGSNIPGVKDAADWLQDKIFHDNFKDYYTATEVSAMQVEAGGTLIGGQSGVDLWNKLRDKLKLTDEEQAIWDEATLRASWYNVLRTQFPQFRLREEEYLDAYQKVTQIFEQQLGMSEEYQDYLWKHNLRPTDVIGGLPLDLRMTLDQMWQWRIWFGRGQILMPPEISDLYAKMNKYWDKVKSYQTDRLGKQADADTGFISPTKELHFTGREWRDQYSINWANYTTKVDSIATDPEFADAIDAMTPAGQVKLAKTLGFASPVRNAWDEALDLYFSIELKKVKDPYTGEEDYDYLGFWLNREAVRQALTEEQRADFDTYIRRYATPMERLFKDISNRYLRGYRAISRIMLEGYTEEQKALIAEFYADTTTSARKDELRDIVGPDGNKLIAGWSSRVSDARERMREASPQLDFWLYVFGYISKPRTKAAQAMVDAWELNKSSIITNYVGGE